MQNEANVYKFSHSEKAYFYYVLIMLGIGTISEHYSALISQIMDVESRVKDIFRLLPPNMLSNGYANGPAIFNAVFRKPHLKLYNKKYVRICLSDI